MGDYDLIEALNERSTMHSVCADVLDMSGSKISARKHKEIAQFYYKVATLISVYEHLEM